MLKNNVCGLFTLFDRFGSEAERTVVEHLIGGTDPVLSPKTLIILSLILKLFSAFLCNNYPVSYPTASLGREMALSSADISVVPLSLKTSTHSCPAVISSQINTSCGGNTADEGLSVGR